MYLITVNYRDNETGLTDISNVNVESFDKLRSNIDSLFDSADDLDYTIISFSFELVE